MMSHIPCNEGHPERLRGDHTDMPDKSAVHQHRLIGVRLLDACAVAIFAARDPRSGVRVFSKTSKPPKWRASRIASGEPCEKIDRLTRESGMDLGETEIVRADKTKRFGKGREERVRVRFGGIAVTRQHTCHMTGIAR